MLPTMLYLRHADAAPRVIRYLNTDPIPLGNTFSADDSPASPEYWTRRNAVIQAGANLLAVSLDGVYKLQPDGETWSNAGVDGGLTFSNADLASGFGATRSGLHPTYVGTTPYIVGWYKSTTNAGSLRGYRLNLNTGVWEEQGDVSTGVDVGDAVGGSPHNEIMFRGRLYFGTAENGGAVAQRSYDPMTGVFASLSHPISAASGLNYVYDYCVFNNTLFMLTPIDMSNGPNGRPALYSLQGTNWNSSPLVLDAVTASLGLTDGGVSRWCLFTDATNLYALCLVNTDGVGTNYGWRCYRITGAFAVTDISSAVLPVELLSLDDGGVGPVPTTGRFFKFIDVDTDPTSPVIGLIYSPNNDPTESFTFYEWVSDAATMISTGTNGVASDAGPNLAQTGGSRIYTPGEMDILITNRQPVIGGERLFFRAWGDPGLSNKTVTFFFDAQGEPITTQCTLDGAATGGSAVRVGNTVQSVDADDGVTEYSVVWNFSFDGVTNGQRVQLAPRIEV